MTSSTIAEFEQVFGGELERRGGLGGVGAVFPENRGATFGRDDGVIGVFQNEHAVADADAERAARAAFADDHGDAAASSAPSFRAG